MVADFNGGWKCTPLEFAVFENNFEACKILIQKGANVNQVPMIGPSLLYWAIRNSNYDICDLLIENGIEINAIDRKGNTTIFYCILDKQFSAKEYLQKKGASSSTIDPLGFSLLTLGKLNRAIKIEHSTLPSFKTLINSLGSSKQDIQYSKNFTLIKLTAHHFSLSGNSTIHLEGQIEGISNVQLEGAQQQYFWKKFADSFSGSDEAVQALRKQVGDETADLIADTCLMSANSFQLSMENKFDTWKSSKPIVLNSGFRRHANSVLVWADRIIFIDRSNSEMPTHKSYHFDQEKLKKNPDLIAQIEALSSELDFEAAQKSLDDIRSKLECTKSDFDIDIDRISLPHQEVGNCTYSNTEASILFLLILSDIKNAQESSKDVDIDSIINEQRTNYENWRFLQQTIIVKKYIASCKQPDRLFVPDMKLLERAILAGSKPSEYAINPVLITRWNHLYHEFLEIAPHDMQERVKTAYVAQMGIYAFAEAIAFVQERLEQIQQMQAQ